MDAQTPGNASTGSVDTQGASAGFLPGSGGSANSIRSAGSGTVGSGSVSAKLTKNFGSVRSNTSSEELSDAGIAKAIHRHDKARDVSTFGAGLAMPFAMIPGFSGVGRALASSLGVVEGFASNDEEVAKAGQRLRSLVPALERASELAQRGAHPGVLAAISEMERALLRVSELFDAREHTTGKLSVTTFRARFKEAIEDVERARNDLLLNLNLEVMSAVADPGRMPGSGAALARCEIPAADLKRNVAECLGAGAYGRVYKGEWQGSAVAIKTVSLAGLSEPQRDEVRRSLQRELAIMVQLRSPRIVHVYGLCVSVPDQLELVIEFVGRGSLRQHLNGLGTPPGDELARQVLSDTALGVKYLHGMSIVHGDLKTHNLLLDDNLRAKVADFGLSAMQTAGASDTGGGLQGSLPWLSPENLAGAGPSTGSDVYAFGIVCWEVVTGAVPWQGESLESIMKKVAVLRARPPLPKATDGNGAAAGETNRGQSELIELMQRCWDQEPLSRPQIAQIAEDLREVSTDA